MVNKLIGLRLTHKIIQKLETIAHNNNQSINYVAKNAITEWVEIFSRTRQQGMMILGRPFIINLLDLVEDENLKTIAITAADRKIDLFQFVLGKHLNRETLDEFIKQAPKILGKKGLMWFDHIEVIKEKNSVHFKCVHNIGEKWSKFFTLVLDHIMEKRFDMELIKESARYSKKALYLEYSAVN